MEAQRAASRRLGKSTRRTTHGSSCVELPMKSFFYVFTVGFVAAVLFQAVNQLEPNRRLAIAL
jgi:hypothetical protein